MIKEKEAHEEMCAISYFEGQRDAFHSATKIIFDIMNEMTKAYQHYDAICNMPDEEFKKFLHEAHDKLQTKRDKTH